MHILPRWQTYRVRIEERKTESLVQQKLHLVEDRMPPSVLETAARRAARVVSLKRNAPEKFDSKESQKMNLLNTLYHLSLISSNLPTVCE